MTRIEHEDERPEPRLLTDDGMARIGLAIWMSIVRHEPVGERWSLHAGCELGPAEECELYENIVSILLREKNRVLAPLPLMQHVDVDDESGKWATTRLHRKHLCKTEDGGCGHIWAPSTLHTVGVRELPEVES